MLRDARRLDLQVRAMTRAEKIEAAAKVAAKGRTCPTAPRCGHDECVAVCGLRAALAAEAERDRTVGDLSRAVSVMESRALAAEAEVERLKRSAEGWEADALVYAQNAGKYERERDEALAALRLVEWGGCDDFDDHYCVGCNWGKDTGHKPDCAVGRVLAGSCLLYTSPSPRDA